MTVYNRTAAVAEQFAAETGATAVAVAALVGRACSVVVTMLADGPAVLALLGGDDGLAAGLSAGDVVIDMGTTGVEHTTEAPAAARRRRRPPRRSAGVGKRRLGGVAQAADHGRRGAGAAGDRVPVLRGIADQVIEVGGPGPGRR